MKKFRLTIVFIAFSALTIGTGAVAMNMLTSASAEQSLVRLTEDQSERDARFIATLVSQLLAEDAPGEPVRPVVGAPTELKLNPSFAGTSLLIDAPTVLTALNIADLAIYDTTGFKVWSSTITGSMQEQLSGGTLAKMLDGMTVSGFVEDVLVPGPDGKYVTSDLVYTFIPLVGERSGETVEVLGVSRAVPADVAGLVGATRSTVMKTTLISLSAVFLVLLAFIMTADVRIWRRNNSALEIEREQKEKLGLRNEELKQLSEARSRFLSSVSHELSGPLASVMAFVDLVLRNKERNLTERQVEHLRVARRNGDQLSRLISDLSDASRADRGALRINYGEFEISTMFEELAESMSPQIKANHQSLQLDVETESKRMLADKGRLIQVVSNLISNASKYSGHGSVVRLHAESDGKELKIEVEDHGIGMSEEDQSQAFKTLFWRSPAVTSGQIPGTGIGLVLTKEIVEQHGGRIELKSELGSGTTVFLSVPLRPAPGVFTMQEADAHGPSGFGQQAAA
jgi:signal transduction histidine kinase